MEAALNIRLEDLGNGESVQIFRTREGETPPSRHPQEHHEHHDHEHHEHYRRTLKWHLGPFDEIVSSAAPQEAAYLYSPWEGPQDMSFTLKDNQSVTFGVSGKDAAGNDSPLTGTPQFAVDDSSVLALTDNGDGSGSVSAQGKIGTATVSVTDAETNGKSFIGSVAIDVVAGDVASVAVTLGAPTDNAPAEAPPVSDVPATPSADVPPADTTPATPTDTTPTDTTPDDPGTTAAATPDVPVEPTPLDPNAPPA